MLGDLGRNVITHPPNRQPLIVLACGRDIRLALRARGLDMRYLLGVAILTALTAAFLIAASAEAQTRSTAAPEVVALDSPGWSNPYLARAARQHPRRYARRTRAPVAFYDVPGRHYPAQHELPPIYYGSRFGF